MVVLEFSTAVDIHINYNKSLERKTGLLKYLLFRTGSAMCCLMRLTATWTALSMLNENGTEFESR